MPTRTLSWVLLIWLSAGSAVGHDPANPDIVVPSARYSSVLSGSQSFRPVEPLPWGDVNRRVMPPDALRQVPDRGKAEPRSKQEERGPHGQR
jgi:hypothetical protein